MKNEYCKQRLINLDYQVIELPNKWVIYKGLTKIIEGTNLTDIYNIIIKRTTK